jgi:hypothetical protein
MDCPALAYTSALLLYRGGFDGLTLFGQLADFNAGLYVNDNLYRSRSPMRSSGSLVFSIF